MKNFKKVLSLALAVLMVIGCMVVAPVNAKADTTYTKVTDAATIAEGGEFVIVAKVGDKYYAFGGVDGSWGVATEVTTESTTVPSVTIEKSASNEGQVVFKCGSEYVKAVSKNNLGLDSVENAMRMSVSETGEDEFSFKREDSEENRYFVVNNTGRTVDGVSGPGFRQYKDKADNSAYTQKFFVYKVVSEEVKTDITLPETATPDEIVDAAYQVIEDGVKLLGTYTLTGVITNIDTAYSSQYKNVSVTIQVGENTKLMGVYRMTAEDKSDDAQLAVLEALAVGDTITVSGTIGSYNGKAQFTAGCVLKDVVKATPEEDKEEELTAEEILELAFALASGEKLDKAYTLTGIVTVINTAYNAQYGNITVTIEIGDKQIQCYRLANGDGVEYVDKIGVGDELTVTGILGAYNGKVEFKQGCTLDAYKDNPDPTPADIEVDDTLTGAEKLAIVNELAKGQSTVNAISLTGVVTVVNTEYNPDYENVTVTIQIGEDETATILCYRIKGEGADVLAVGDEITVTGKVTNYNGTIEFVAGSTFEAVEVPETPEEPEIPEKGDNFLPMFAILFAGAAFVAVAAYGKKKNS